MPNPNAQTAKTATIPEAMYPAFQELIERVMFVDLVPPKQALKAIEAHAREALDDGKSDEQRRNHFKAIATIAQKQVVGA